MKREADIKVEKILSLRHNGYHFFFSEELWPNSEEILMQLYLIMMWAYSDAKTRWYKQVPQGTPVPPEDTKKLKGIEKGDGERTDGPSDTQQLVWEIFLYCTTNRFWSNYQVSNSLLSSLFHPRRPSNENIYNLAGDSQAGDVKIRTDYIWLAWVHYWFKSPPPQAD